MNSLRDRLRSALLISPALLLWHLWILASADGQMLRYFGVLVTVVLAIVSSLVESYCIVLAISLFVKQQCKGD